MIHAYAIEPKALAEWAKSPLAGRYILENFGVGHPALMAEYPKFRRWKKDFYDMYNSIDDEIERKMLEDLFQHVTAKTVRRSGFNYDGNNSWLDNAEKEDLRYPFKAIIAHQKRTNNERVLDGNEIGSWPKDRWNPKRGDVATKKAQEMTRAVRAMLHNSQEIIFIDPYFSPFGRDYEKSIGKFLQECISKKLPQEKKQIEIHASAKTKFNKVAENEPFQKECEKKISPLLTAEVTVVFKRWISREDSIKLHNRYILTDIGGVSFPYGLAEGKPGQTDELHLLTFEQHNLVWEQYVGEKPAFDLQFEFAITGK